MFGSLFKQAKATIETSITEVVDRAIVAVPFLIAGGFLTTALAAWLIRTYGLEIGALVVGGIFVVLGLILNAAMPSRQTTARVDELPENPELNAAEQQAESEIWSETERDVMKAALAASAPHAVPYIMRLILRNLPLVAALLGAAFVLTRSSTERPEAPFQPAPAE